MKHRQKILDYINKSTIERENGRVVGLFEGDPNRISLHFKNESYILKQQNGDNIKKPYGESTFSIYHRDIRKETILTEDDFFAYLDLFIEIDLLRQKQVELRKLVIAGDITSYRRNIGLKKLINES